MTQMIHSISQAQGTPEATGQASAGAPIRATGVGAAPVDIAADGGEAVTLSADALTTTQLLDAARSADGVNQSAVQQLRGAIQNGTYDVSPESLARAISGAFKETAP